MSDHHPGQSPEIPAAPAPPPYGQPAAYAQPGYPAPYYGAPAYPAASRTNVLAIISMIASIVGFIWLLPFIGSLAGIIMGHISLRQIAATGENGRGMALAGVIVGYVGLALLIIGIVILWGFLAVAISQGSRYSA